VERHRHAITVKMHEHLAAMETEDESFGQSEVTSLMLVEFLLEGARDLAAFATTRDLSFIASEHRRLDLDGRHYSRFGGALAPVLRAAVGPALPPAIVSGWCDAFWFLVRQLNLTDTRSGRPHLKLRLR
jgi:hypothetical protein